MNKGKIRKWYSMIQRVQAVVEFETCVEVNISIPNGVTVKLDYRD